MAKVRIFTASQMKKYGVYFMEKLSKIINEFFFFRVEGLENNDHSCDKPLTSQSVEHENGTTPKSQPTDPCVEVNLDDSNNSTSTQVISSNTARKEPSCISISVYSAVVIAMVIIFLIFGRDYIKYVLLSLENANFCISLAVFAVLFIIVSFPMTWGYILLNIAAGYLYGLLIGIAVVIVCALLGVFVAHMVIRRCLQNFVMARFANDTVRATVKIVDSDNGLKVVAWARLTPIPFGLQNALFAISRISTPRYLLASALGMCPSQGMHSYIGSTLRSMEEVIYDTGSNTMTYFIFGGQLLLAVALLIFVVRKAKMEFNKMLIEDNAASSGTDTASITDQSEISCDRSKASQSCESDSEFSGASPTKNMISYHISIESDPPQSGHSLSNRTHSRESSLS